MAEDIYFIPETMPPHVVLSASEIEKHGILYDDAEVPFDGDPDDVMELDATDMPVEPVAKAAEANVLQDVKDCLDLLKAKPGSDETPSGTVDSTLTKSNPSEGVLLSNRLEGQEYEEQDTVEDHFPSLDFGEGRSTVIKSVTHKIDKDDDDDTDAPVDKFPSIRL